MPTIAELDIRFDPAAHTYTVNGARVPAVTEVLRAVGLSTDWTAKPPDVREAAERKRALGQVVHDACARLDRQQLKWDEVPEAAFSYVEAWEAYVKQRGILDFEAIEQPVAHPTLRYAGTLDRIAETTNERILCDIKIGDPEDAAGQYQTAAYAGTFLDQRFTRECVRLYPSGRYVITAYESRDDWKVFQAALTVFHSQPSRRTRA